jgi:hypothetical protein
MNRFFLIALAALGLCSSAGAVTTWNFSSSPDHSLGVTSFAYTVGGVTITASGFYNNNTGRILYDKFTTSVTNDESGLGFTDDAFGNHEIDTSGFIVLNLSNSFFNGKSLALTITSIQAGESYQWYHGSSTGAGATQGLSLVASTLTSSPLTFMGGGSNSFIAIEATSHNVLLNSLTATATPEPRFYGLLLASLLGLAGIVYRKRHVTE